MSVSLQLKLKQEFQEHFCLAFTGCLLQFIAAIQIEQFNSQLLCSMPAEKSTTLVIKSHHAASLKYELPVPA